MTLSNEVYTELYIDDTWVDISTDVQVRDNNGQVSVKRGKANEASNVEPSTCDFELNNRGGQYSPRNPLSDYFGLLGRNTPVRTGLRDTEVIDTFTRTETSTWGYSESGINYDTFGTGGTVADTDWTVSSGQGVMSVPVTSANRISAIADNITGPLSIHQAYLDSSVAVTFNLVPADVTGGALEPANIILRGQSASDYYMVRVQVETDESVTVAIRRETAGTVIAGPVTVSGLTYAPATAIRVRFEARGTTLRTRVWNAALAEPSTWDISTTSSLITKSGWSGIRSGVSAGNSNAKPILFKYDNLEMTVFRFVGEVSTFPPKWDITGNDAWVPIEASGILRRLKQGKKSLGPNLKQYIIDSTDASSYWPLDDGTDSTSGVNLIKPSKKFYKASATAANGSVSFGSGNLGATMDKGLSIAYTDTTTAGYMYGYVNGAATQTAIAVDFLYKAEKLGVARYSMWVMNSTTHALDKWTLSFNGNDTGNNVEVTAELDILPNFSSAVFIGDSAVLTALTDGNLHHVRFLMAQDGADIDLSVWIDGTSVFTGTYSTRTLGSALYLDVVYIKNEAQTDLALGHAVVYENANVPAIADSYEAASSHTGETAGDRFTRLCSENNVPSVVLGTSSDSITMGPQYPDSFLDILYEVLNTDLGQMFETRDYLGLSYRLRTDLYNQDAIATIDFSDGELGKPLEPVDDDQQTRNDIFAQRREGASYQATLESGSLSVLEPPNGVGRYKDEKVVNVQYDNQLADVAGWLLALGTIDASRYPTIVVNLHSPSVQANSTLLAALRKANIGDRLDIVNASSIGIYDDISGLILGYKETFNKFKHTIEFNCLPYAPYNVSVWGTSATVGTDRYETANSTLVSGIDSDDVTMSVASVAGTGTPKTLWTTDDTTFPFDIFVGGERMTVTDIANTTSPQTFTVTRSVNGVVKSHSAATSVRLWDTPRYAL